MARLGAGLGMAQPSPALLGMAWHSVAGLRSVQHGTAWCAMAGLGSAQRSVAWLDIGCGLPKPGMASLSLAWPNWT